MCLQSDAVTNLGLQVQPAVLLALVAALNMNVFITGLNQMYDIQIDLVNKPYLPVASGEFPVPFAWAMVLMQGITGALTALAFGTPALAYTVVGSGVIGVVYSHPHPLFRWKRFPTPAASCIFVIRGLVVQIGFYEHMRLSVDAEVGSWHANKTLTFSIAFFVVLGVAIALFKDVPDIAGDAQADIQTLAVQMGPRSVVNLTAVISATAYLTAAGFWAANGYPAAAAAHLALGFVLVRKLHGTVVDGPAAAEGIRSSYMTIWKVIV